jgi:hypothetical protein
MSIITLSATMPRLAASKSGVLRRIPLAVWNGALLAIVIGLGVVYLIEVNRTVAHGYQIRDAESRVMQLRTETRSNQVKLSEIEAMGNLTAQAQTLGMVPVGQVEYVSKPTSGVAMR